MKKLLTADQLKNFAFLHIALLVYTSTNIIGKLGAPYEVMSFEFIAWFALKVALLGVYAILWQQALKRFKLTTAYANKAITVVWGLVFGALFFGEAVTWTKILGCLLIFGGILLAVTKDE